MSEDPFMCPECEYHGVSVLDAGFIIDPVLELDCCKCGCEWRVEAATEDFEKL